MDQQQQQPRDGLPQGRGEIFRKGVGISTWQCSGDDGLSNWTRFANRRRFVSSCGFGFTNYNIGKSCDFWNRFREDLHLAKQAGCNAFRFSFEWARIEPTRGKIDESAVKRFHEMLDVMEELGLEPCATLHHLTHPLWFEKLGAFVNEDNIPIFVDYAVFMFKTFGHRIRMWATFNEPTCITALGYIAGMAPPGNFLRFKASGQALLTILKAHVESYHAIKALPGGKDAQVGLIHHHITFEPRGSGWLYGFSRYISKVAQYCWGWEVVDQWMRTGEFTWDVPIFGRVLTYKDPRGKPPMDWWGINAYSRPVVAWYIQPTHFSGEIMTDMPYPIYPQQLYNAIKRSSAYGVPIYITETGIADSRDDRRSLFINSYVKEVLRALADGYDVRGFYYWTLVDSFEWSTGFTMKFGLYAWEPDGSVDRKLREGSQALIHLYNTLPDDLASLKAVARGAERSLEPAGPHAPSDERTRALESEVEHKPVVPPSRAVNGGHQHMESKPAAVGGSEPAVLQQVSDP